MKKKLILVISILSILLLVETSVFADRLWFKDGADSNLYKFSHSLGGYNESAYPYATITAHAKIESNIGMEKIRVFARTKAIEELSTGTSEVYIRTARAGFKAIDSRKTDNFTIQSSYPSESTWKLVDDIPGYELLGAITELPMEVVQVIGNGIYSKVTHTDVNEYDKIIELSKTSGLEKELMDLPLFAKADMQDAFYDAIEKGYVAKFTYSLDTMYDSMNNIPLNDFEVRAWGQIYYDARVNTEWITIQSAYATVDHRVRATY